MWPEIAFPFETVVLLSEDTALCKTPSFENMTRKKENTEEGARLGWRSPC